MNKILNTAKIVLNNSNISVRTYAFKSDLKIKWVRPEKISCIKPQKSGDQSAMPVIDKSIYPIEFQGSKELETADENVKRLFSLELSPKYQTTNYYTKTLIDQVKRHELDYGSMESTLANQTAKIRSMQVIMEKFPRNKRMKVELKELIDKRKKFLTKLRGWDYKRFEWILEKLDLIYKAYPSKYHWITRKDSLRKLTDIHCDNIRNERLAAYRQELENRQIEFLEKKLANLKFIRNEQIECRFPVTVHEDDIKTIELKLSEMRTKKSENIQQNAKTQF